MGTATSFHSHPNRPAGVNKNLELLGVEERLFRGEGYYYFAGGKAAEWYQSGVYGVSHISELTIAQWLYEWHRLSTSKKNG